MRASRLTEVVGTLEGDLLALEHLLGLRQPLLQPLRLLLKRPPI